MLEGCVGLTCGPSEENDVIPNTPCASGSGAFLLIWRTKQYKLPYYIKALPTFFWCWCSAKWNFYWLLSFFASYFWSHSSSISRTNITFPSDPLEELSSKIYRASSFSPQDFQFHSMQRVGCVLMSIMSFNPFAKLICFLIKEKHGLLLCYA